MIKQRYGEIINIASWAGMGAGEANNHYRAAKAGIIGFTKSLAREVAQYNINVNAVSPGNILTDMNSAAWLNIEEKIARFVEHLPFKRRPLPGHVANVVVFLASGGASHITGINVKVSRGQYT